MKNLTSITKGIAVIVVLNIFLVTNTSFGQITSSGIGTQSDCFTLSIVNINLSSCENENCPAGVNDGNKCDHCFDVDVSSCTNQNEQACSFEVSSNDCFSICSPSGDFWLSGYSGPHCNNANKQFVWHLASSYPTCTGMATTDHGVIRICGSGFPQTFHMRLVGHCGTLCTTPNPCNDAILGIDGM